MASAAAGALSGLALLAAAGPAAAWSDLGHRVVADLAYERLTPAAKRQVDEIIAVSASIGEPSCPVSSLADAATFPSCAQEIGRYRVYRRMHSDPQPYCGTPPRTDWCKNGQCASEAVKRAIAVLRDPAQQPGARLIALEELSHFLADVHQPLDEIDNRDGGGEDIHVTLPGSAAKGLNLHDVWNDALTAVAVGSEDIGLRYLEPTVRRGPPAWAAGDVNAWAAETHALAVSIYGHLPQPPVCGSEPKQAEALDRGYVLAAVPVVREQLAKAGVRLAAVLNAVFG